MYFWENDIVRLRSLEEEDCAVLSESYKDTIFCMQSQCGVGLSRSETDAYYFIAAANEENRLGRDVRLAIETLEGEFVGIGSLLQIDERHGNACVSLTIFPKEQKKGYGKAALCILLSYAFDERRIHKVDCHLLRCNESGIAFTKKAGFTLECNRREMYFTHGRYYDELIYGMTEAEYREWKENGFAVCQSKIDENSQITEETVGQEAESSVKHAASSHDEGKEKFFCERENFWQYKAIKLRQTMEEDIPFMLDLLEDSDGCRYYYHDVILADCVDGIVESMTEHLNFGGEDGRLEFTITDLEGEYVGNINLFSIDEKNGKFSLSIYVHKGRRGYGFGSQALCLILTYCFMELRLHKFVVAVDEGNEASERIMRKAGCKLEGVHREMVYYNGSYVNEKYLGMTKEEFIRCIEWGKNYEKTI